VHGEVGPEGSDLAGAGETIAELAAQLLGPLLERVLRGAVEALDLTVGELALVS
jgi:hypothetical protein